MKYRNIKNGSVIDIPCTLTDVNWEALEPSKPQSDEEVPAETTNNNIKKPEATKKNTKKTVKKG